MWEWYQSYYSQGISFPGWRWSVFPNVKSRKKIWNKINHSASSKLVAIWSDIMCKLLQPFMTVPGSDTVVRPLYSQPAKLWIVRTLKQMPQVKRQKVMSHIWSDELWSICYHKTLALWLLASHQSHLFCVVVLFRVHSSGLRGAHKNNSRQSQGLKFNVHSAVPPRNYVSVQPKLHKQIRSKGNITRYTLVSTLSATFSITFT